MSIQQHCLDNIIGLSQTGCECLNDNMPVDALTSNSGIYLDRLEGLNLNLIDSAADCETGNVWELMDRARNDAIKMFKQDIMASLLTKYKQKRQPFSGTIGSPKFTRSIDLGSGFYGIRVFCSNIIGGVMSLKRIGLVFDSSATFNIYIYGNLSDSPLATYTVTSVANQLAWYNLTLPFNMEMDNYGNENPEYFILYEKSTFKPKDNQLCCGCSGGNCKWYFNYDNPRFSKQEKDRWTEFVMVGGTNIADTSVATRDAANAVNQTYGLILDVDFKCRTQDLICKEPLDFENNPVAQGIAFAIQFKAGELLVDLILASSQINRFTMTDRERLMGKKNTYARKYNEQYIPWLTDNINYKANDCLACQDFDDVIKAGIFS